ncbi:MAG: hypothetical protein HOP11_11850 [Saprospiraceae bacterium]|nr:hypothetical protein [Saprospiraceae bacterium]
MKSQFNSIQLLQFTLLIFLSLFSTLSCKKNELIDLAIKPTKLDINRVKDYYLRNKSLDSRTNNDMFVNNNSIPQFNLAWELAYYPSAYNGLTVFIPIKDKELITNKYLDATMVFLLDSLNNIEQRLLVLAMDNIYYESNQL